MSEREEKLLKIDSVLDILSDVYGDGYYGYEYILSKLIFKEHNAIIKSYGLNEKEVRFTSINSFREELVKLSNFWFRNHSNEEISEKSKQEILFILKSFEIKNFHQLTFDEKIIEMLIDFVGINGKVFKLISTIGKDEKNLIKDTNLVFTQHYLIEFKDSCYGLYFEMTT